MNLKYFKIGILKKYIWYKVVIFLRNSNFYPIIYKSWWHFQFSSSTKKDNELNYFSAVPNRGAGIGHQMANWIAGFWYAKQFNLKFAHTPFAQNSWEEFLGFGENEITVEELWTRYKYKRVLLPQFNEFKHNEVDLIKKIIKSYQDQKVVFIAEQDQFYQDQYGVQEDLKGKFYHAKARKENKLNYDSRCFNIAIHIRRGDIITRSEKMNFNLQMRWQNNQYYLNVLKNFQRVFKIDKPFEIYIFSQGEKSDFKEFNTFENVHFCLDISAEDSFLHMVYADLLITSKSSFSYKPALISNGLKICPKDFWHGYPDTKDFILADEAGNLININ